jgi:hypothetical protein
MIRSYDKSHCWQYDIRQRYLETELLMLGMTKDDLATLRTRDFTLSVLGTDTELNAAKRFIKRYEWLGDSGHSPLFYFGTHYNDILAGVIIMRIPNAAQHILGGNLELLITRGACASWTPKNLASHFLMECIDWLVANTEFRVFTAYADITAKELGTIYQAANFYYLGNTFGTSRMYYHPYNGNLISDRGMRNRSMYRRHAKELGIEWNQAWSGKFNVLWDNVPDEIEAKLRTHNKKVQAEADYVEVPHKHKYVYIKGNDKRETKYLRRKFEAHNKTYQYPKERGQ